MKWFLTACVLWLASGTALAQHRYWDANYDSLTRALAQQRTDTARLRTVVHLLDLHPTNSQALPLLDQLLELNQRTPTLNDAPYRRLRAGLELWYRGNADAAALDTVKNAIAAFDKLQRPIPWLLIDLVALYNRTGAMEARKEYYEEKLSYYRVRGALENAAACYVSQGAYYRRMGDYNRAINSSLRAADMAQGFSRTLYIHELIVTGAIYADWDNNAKAVYYLNMARALPEFRRVQGPNRLFTYVALSRLYMQQGQYSSALQAADSALAVRAAASGERGMTRAHGLVQKAAVLLRMQQAAAAGPLLQRARAISDSLKLPISDKPGELELDATLARYYVAQQDYARAETHWLRAYSKATAAKFDRLRPRYLKELAAFYDARGRPAEAQRYSRAYIGLVDSISGQQNSFHVAQYESERVEQAQNAQISNLREAQAVQAERLRLGNWLLLGALLTVVLVSVLSAFIYRQLRTNRRTLDQLRQTQSQLVQAEKMAFLGELTAGIAHELQNPLNFMKNFAEVSADLVADMGGAGSHGSGSGLQGEILAGLKQNLQQISQHGQRASSIITDMLAHSRVGEVPRQATDLNALASDSLSLAYAELQGQDRSFQASLVTDFGPGLEAVAVVGPDLGRALLNLCANALYAVRARQQQDAALAGAGANGGACPAAYEPTVWVSTRRIPGSGVEIRVRDNGTGMTEEVRAQVFQSFFTTKPAGEGTGLGLSLSHDIVTKGHNGTLTVKSQEGQGTEFIVTLPQ